MVNIIIISTSKNNVVKADTENNFMKKIASFARYIVVSYKKLYLFYFRCLLFYDISLRIHENDKTLSKYNTSEFL